MAYCNNCTQEKPDDQKFCDSCGAELSASTTAEPATPAQPASPQPVYSAEQFQQHKEQAMNIFSKLDIGMKISAIGAAAAFVFSLASMIWFLAQTHGMFLGSFFWMVISGAVSLFFVYLYSIKSGKQATLCVTALVSLGSMWVPWLFMMGSFGGLLPGGFSALLTLAALSGVAVAVGAFIEIIRRP